MTCWAVRRRLVAYDDGDLSSDQAAEIEVHLAACQSCSDELAELRGAIGMVESLAQVETGPEFTANVLAAIRAESETELSARPVMWPAAVGLGLAGAVVSVALIVGLVALDWESVRQAAVALAPSARALLDVAGLVFVQLIQMLDTLSQALTQPIQFALLADVLLLMAVLVVWRRLATVRSAAGIGAILA
jgi:anti-sigma factor RsiW